MLSYFSCNFICNYGHKGEYNLICLSYLSNDADICVILTSNVHHLSNSHLWYDSGLDYDNSREHVDITSLSRSINYTKSLAGAYAFLGIDYSPAFFGKGKVKPLEIMTMKNKFLDAFASLGENALTVDIMVVIEEFICWMYGYRKQSEINEVIRMVFEEKSKPKANQRPLDCIKAKHPTKFPPCKNVLEQQIKRAWYIAKLYKSACEAYLAFEYTPIDFGWKLSECSECLDIKWFEGPQVPIEIDQIDGSDVADDANSFFVYSK